MGQQDGLRLLSLQTVLSTPGPGLQGRSSLPVSQLGKPKPSIQGAEIPLVQREPRPSANGTCSGTPWRASPVGPTPLLLPPRHRAQPCQRPQKSVKSTGFNIKIFPLKKVHR